MTNAAESGQTSQLKITNLLPGILSISYRIPWIISAIKAGLSLDGETRLSIGAVLEKNASRHPDKTAILFEDRRLTHREFNEAVNRMAACFIDRGLTRGDTAAVFVENRPELLMVIGALAKIGAVASLINTRQRGKVLLHSFNLNSTRMIVVGEELIEAFDEVRDGLELGNIDFFFLADRQESYPPEGFLDLSALSRTASSENPAATGEVRLKDPYAYVFTSGTTGLPKASIQTHRRWMVCYYWFGKVNMNMKPKDTLYVPIPFFHTNALSVAWPSAASGGSAMAIRRKFSASAFLEDVRKYKATSFIYVGELCRYLMNQPPTPNDRENPIYKIVGNGLRPDIWKDFKKRFGIKKVYELYGAADGTIGFTNTFNVDCTVGWCASKYAVVKYDIDADEPVFDENGFMIKAPQGEPGLVLGEISDQMPFAGYTDKESTEKKIFRNVFEKGDMWFNTGDIMRDIGFKHCQFVDRIGDTFRWKGENVSTTEVEEVLNIFDQTSESTVYGVAIPNTDGKAGMASIIPAEGVGQFNFDGLADYIRSSLPAYAVPLFIRLQTELEITATYKNRKPNLKKEGFDPGLVKDPIYVLLPGNGSYEPLTQEIYQDIAEAKYRF